MKVTSLLKASQKHLNSCIYRMGSAAAQECYCSAAGHFDTAAGTKRIQGEQSSCRAWSMAVAATDISGIVTGRILPGSCGQHTACHTCKTSEKEQGTTQRDQRTCHFHSAAIARASARDGTASVCRAGVRSLRPSKNTCHNPCSAAGPGLNVEAGGCANLRACLCSPGTVPCRPAAKKYCAGVVRV